MIKNIKLLFVVMILFFSCAEKKKIKTFETNSLSSIIDTIMITYSSSTVINKRQISMKQATEYWKIDSFGCTGIRDELYFESDFFSKLKKFKRQDIILTLGKTLPFLIHESRKFDNNENMQKYFEYTYVISAGKFWCDEEMKKSDRNYDFMPYLGIVLEFNINDSINRIMTVTGGG